MGLESLLKRAPETTIAWFAACLSVLLAIVAFLPTLSLRVFLAIAGLGITIATAPAALQRATPTTTAVITVAAAILSMVAVLLISKASLESGLAISRAGGAGHPGRWLFASSCWCLAAGLIPTGRLMLQQGRRTAHLGLRAYRAASLLPPLSALGWVIVGAVPVGANGSLDTIHTNAAIVAMGAFWIGMVATSWGHGLSRHLQRFSRAAVVVVMITWLPTELKILGIIVTSPVKTMYMQAIVAVLSAVWLGWLAREWQQPQESLLTDRRGDDVSGAPRLAKGSAA